jgi:hypothetical protein
VGEFVGTPSAAKPFWNAVFSWANAGEVRIRLVSPPPGTLSAEFLTSGATPE